MRRTTSHGVKQTTQHINVIRALRRSILKQHHATSITAIISKATNPQAAAESVDHRHPAIIIVLLLLL
jgi:hypothetical protein